MEELFVEIVSFVNRRNANLKPISCLDNSIGFRSVYMFSKEDAEIIRERGSSKGFKYFNLYSDCLFVDIDIKSEEEDKIALREIEELKKKGFRFSLYTSGGRSYHLHIPHELKCSRHLPYTHKLLVEKLGITCDHSLYRANSLFRLAGTIHSKTGEEKTLIGEYGSKELKFSIQQEPLKEYNKKEDISENPFLFFSVLRDLCYERVVENRYLKFFSLSCLLIEYSNISYSSLLEVLLLANKSLPEPNEEEEVVRALKGAWERIKEES